MRGIKVKNLLAIPLRPYPGRLLVTNDKKRYCLQIRDLFGDKNAFIEKGVEGRCATGYDLKGKWTALVWARTPWNMAHELSHVMLATFNKCGIPVTDDNSEAFCYALSQLMLDAAPLYGRKKRLSRKRK